MKPLTAATPRGQTQKTSKTRSGKWPLVAGLLVFCGLGGFGLSRYNATSSAPSIQTAAPQPTQAVQLEWQVVNSYPHDPKAFTQGLVWHNGGFYEGTGLEGQSTLRRVEFPSGKVLKKRDLPRDVFGEGLALVGDKLVQLTWTSRRGFVWDRDSFRLLGEFAYATEGWGLTYDGKYLILSDGTSTLTYLDAQTYQPLRQLPVTFNGQPLRNLNELEYVNGAIWANVWQTDQLMRIDPASGRVTAYLDFSGLLPARMRTGREDVLNGIAYDDAKKRLFVTGKLWPRLFEIRVPSGGL